MLPEANIKWRTERNKQRYEGDHLVVHGGLGIKRLLQELHVGTLPTEPKQQVAAVVEHGVRVITAMTTTGGVMTLSGIVIAEDLSAVNLPPNLRDRIQNESVVRGDTDSLYEQHGLDYRGVTKGDLYFFTTDLSSRVGYRYSSKGDRRGSLDFYILDKNGYETPHAGFERPWTRYIDRYYRSKNIPPIVSPGTIVIQALYDIAWESGRGELPSSK